MSHFLPPFLVMLFLSTGFPNLPKLLGLSSSLFPSSFDLGRDCLVWKRIRLCTGPNSKWEPLYFLYHLVCESSITASLLWTACGHGQCSSCFMFFVCLLCFSFGLMVSVGPEGMLVLISYVICMYPMVLSRDDLWWEKGIILVLKHSLCFIEIKKIEDSFKSAKG